MPLYPYKCTSKDCKHTFDDVQTIAKYKVKKKCPECGRPTLRRVLTTAKLGAVVGAGDTTGAVVNEDGSRMRLKTGTEKEQKREIELELEKKQQQEVKDGKSLKRNLEYRVH